MSDSTDRKLRAIEGVLFTHMGPLGPITMETQLKNLGISKDGMENGDVGLLVEQIDEAVSSLLGDVKGKTIRSKLDEIVEK